MPIINQTVETFPSIDYQAYPNLIPNFPFHYFTSKSVVQP